MEAQEVRKKKYSLTQTEISAIREVLHLLSQITDDDDITDAIQSEAWVGIEDAVDILNIVLNFDGKDLGC